MESHRFTWSRIATTSYFKKGEEKNREKERKRPEKETKSADEEKKNCCALNTTFVTVNR